LSKRLPFLPNPYGKKTQEVGAVKQKKIDCVIKKKFVKGLEELIAGKKVSSDGAKQGSKVWGWWGKRGKAQRTGTSA